MMTRPEVVALAQNGSRPARDDDGASRLGTPTALQLRSPLDDAIAIAADDPEAETRGEGEEKEEWRLRSSGAKSAAAIKRATGGRRRSGMGDIQMPPAIGGDICAPARHWAT